MPIPGVLRLLVSDGRALVTFGGLLSTAMTLTTWGCATLRSRR